MKPFLFEIARLEEAREARSSTEALQRGRDSGSDFAVEHINTGVMLYGGKDSWWNQARGLGMDGPVTDQELDRLVEFYASRGTVPQIAVSTYAHPSLFQGLAVRNFVVKECGHVLIRKLHRKENFWARWPYERPGGVSVEIVDPTDEQAMHAYAEVQSSGFRPANTAMTPDMLDFNRSVLMHPRCKGFAIRMSGEIVATGAVELGHDISALRGATVLPEFRGRGLQAMLMIARLDEAREFGSKLMVVQARVGVATERNALRLGFSMAFAKLIMIKPDALGTTRS